MQARAYTGDMTNVARRGFLRSVIALGGVASAGCSTAAPAPPTAAPAPTSAPPKPAAPAAGATSAAPATTAPAAATVAPAAAKPASLTPIKLVWVALTANQMVWPVAKEGG